jgi:hypothetical protein
VIDDITAVLDAIGSTSSATGRQIPPQTSRGGRSRIVWCD